MSRKQTLILLTLAGLGLLFFALFIAPNSLGARDANMLTIFEVDEYAQYPHALRMLTPGATFYQSLRNFFVYLHYFYGFPFYFFSALAMLPVRLFSGANWADHTQTILIFLRQGVSVLPMILAILIQTWLVTRFRSWRRALLVFVLLISLPVVWVNNLWWHPDGLLVLWITLTFFFLDRDDLRFGRNFLLAAAACGLAVGTKALGLFFFLTVPLYIAWGLAEKRLTWRRALGMAAAFVGVMLATIVITNPLLLLPQERAAIIQYQKQMFTDNTGGFLVRSDQRYFGWGRYPADFRNHYGALYFILLALAGLLLGMVRSEHKRLYALMLAFILPLSAYFVFGAAFVRTYYLLPVILPLAPCVVALFPPGGLTWPGAGKTARRAALGLQLLAAAALLVQFGRFVQQDVNIYTAYQAREQTAPGIAFFNRLDQEVLSRIPADTPLVFYRDWRAYVPPRPHWRVEINWDLANYAYINDLNPDFILIDRRNVALFTDPKAMQQAVDRGDMQQWQTFYADVLRGEVPGYRLLWQDDFGFALVKDAVWEKVLQ